MDYPYEGDLTAVIAAVTIPRRIRETIATICQVFKIPDMSTQVDELLADITWKTRRAE